MDVAAEFSKPVVVDEGVAFCVRLADGRQRIAVATKARLGIADEAQGLALLAAFARDSDHLCEEAEQLVQAGAVTPVYLGRH